MGKSRQNPQEFQPQGKYLLPWSREHTTDCLTSDRYGKELACSSAHTHIFTKIPEVLSHGHLFRAQEACI